MNLSVITVTWNSAKLISEQIESVKTGCQNILFEEIVVDNGSTDETVKIVKEKYPSVKLVDNKKNLGFSASNNIAATMSSGEFLLFLNPDMRVAPGSLDKMVEWMRSRPDVGLASCKLVDEKGELNADAQPRRFPGLFDQLAIILKLPHLFPSILNNYMFKGFNADKEQEVDSIRGSFMIMRREVFEKLGFAFDPRYFIWFEDVDICREVKKLGYKVMHTPIISCVDYIGQSFKQRTTLWKQKNFTKSMLTYFQKWEPWYKWVFIAAFKPLGIFSVFFLDCIRKYYLILIFSMMITFLITNYFFSFYFNPDLNYTSDKLRQNLMFVNLKDQFVNSNFIVRYFDYNLYLNNSIQTDFFVEPSKKNIKIVSQFVCGVDDSKKTFYFNKEDFFKKIPVSKDGTISGKNFQDCQINFIPTEPVRLNPGDQLKILTLNGGISMSLRLPWYDKLIFYIIICFSTIGLLSKLKKIKNFVREIL